MAKAKPKYYAAKTIAADGKRFEAGEELVGVRPGVLKSMLRLGQATTDAAGAAALEELSASTTDASKEAAKKKAAKKAKAEAEKAEAEKAEAEKAEAEKAEAEKAEAEKKPLKAEAEKKSAKKTAEAG